MFALLASTFDGFLPLAPAISIVAASLSPLATMVMPVGELLPLPALQMPLGAAIAPLADAGVTRFWHAAPLIVSISLVYAATRHEQMVPIIGHAVRFCFWVVVFMALVLAVLQGLNWMAG